MTNYEVTQRLNELKNEFPSTKFWNHIGSTVNDPSSTTSQPCTHHDSGCDVYGSCDCNCFANAIQCHGFAKYMAYRVFGTFPDVTSYYNDVYNGLDLSNGWKLYTNSYVSNIEIEPGDVIRVGTHTAIVHYVRGNEVFVGEVWGDPKDRPDLRCKIAWGHFDNSPSNTASVLKNNLIFIAKAPKTGKTCKISNYSNGKYLNVVGTTLNNNQSVTTLASNGTDGQKWYINGYNNGEYIRSAVDAEYVLSTGSSNACVLSNNDSSQSNMVDIVIVGENSTGKICIIRKSNDNFTCLTSDGTRAYWDSFSSGNNLQKWIFAEL